MQALGRELGGPERADQLIHGEGVSLILKSLTIDYKAPVTFPDTLLEASNSVSTFASIIHSPLGAFYALYESDDGGEREQEYDFMQVQDNAASIHYRRITRAGL